MAAGNESEGNVSESELRDFMRKGILGIATDHEAHVISINMSDASVDILCEKEPSEVFSRIITRCVSECMGTETRIVVAGPTKLPKRD